MKTAVSIADDTFERAERRAQELGMSRSRLYSTAVERWLDAQEEAHITEQIDDVLAGTPQDDADLAFLTRAASRLAAPPTSR